MRHGDTASSRMVTLDLTKGLLVVFMVIYHSLNYSTEPHLAFHYLAFLPPSFILITGFLISYVYLPRYSVGDSHLHSRLILRGARLFVLFTALNLAAKLVLAHRTTGVGTGIGAFWSNWFDIYLIGAGHQVAFDVLLPISYVLMLAPAFICVTQLHNSVLLITTFAVLGLFTLLERSGTLWNNAQLMSAGIVGMLAGRAPSVLLNKSSRHLLPGLLAYAIYLSLSSTFGQTYLLQLFGACIALIVIHSFCAEVNIAKPLQVRLELLGRYSLIAYILHIVVLQLLVRRWGVPEPASLNFFALLLGALVLTTAAVEVFDATRARSGSINSIYKAVFA